MYSNPLTWQDRMIVKIGHALVAGHASKTTKPDFEEEVNSKQVFILTSHLYVLKVRRIKSSRPIVKVVLNAEAGSED